MFEELAANVAEAPPNQPKPLTQDGLLGLFKGEAVGRDVVLEPATMEDMCGVSVDREALARSRLRQRVRTIMASSNAAIDLAAPDLGAPPRRRPDATSQRRAGDGLGCHAGKDEMREAAKRPA